jgi:hypothetical protein
VWSAIKIADYVYILELGKVKASISAKGLTLIEPQNTDQIQLFIAQAHYNIGRQYFHHPYHIIEETR